MNEKEMNEIVEKFIGCLTDEQKEKAMSCENMDEFMKLAGEWGVELPDEIVEAVAGGYIYKVYPDMWKVINDYCGSVMCTVYSDNRARVENEALKAGQSKREISHLGVRKIQSRFP